MIKVSTRKSFLSTVVMVIAISALFITVLNVKNSISKPSTNGVAVGREVSFSK